MAIISPAGREGRHPGLWAGAFMPSKGSGIRDAMLRDLLGDLIHRQGGRPAGRASLRPRSKAVNDGMACYPASCSTSTLMPASASACCSAVRLSDCIARTAFNASMSGQGLQTHVIEPQQVHRKFGTTMDTEKVQDGVLGLPPRFTFVWDTWGGEDKCLMIVALLTSCHGVISLQSCDGVEQNLTGSPVHAARGRVGFTAPCLASKVVAPSIG